MFSKIEMPISTMEDGSIILYDRNTENTHVLNSTAATIYNLCDQFTVSEIAQKLVENVEDKPEISEVIDDVNQVIKMLLDENLVITED